MDEKMNIKNWLKEEKKDYFDDKIHYSSKGYDLMGENIFFFLIKQNILK
jgi:hypothetical protein